MQSCHRSALLCMCRRYPSLLTSWRSRHRAQIQPSLATPSDPAHHGLASEAALHRPPTDHLSPLTSHFSRSPSERHRPFELTRLFLDPESGRVQSFDPIHLLFCERRGLGGGRKFNQLFFV